MGLLKKRAEQPPTAPLQALRGHNTRERLLCPPKQQLSYHLGGSVERKKKVKEEEEGKGRKVQHVFIKCDVSKILFKRNTGRGGYVLWSNFH